MSAEAQGANRRAGRVIVRATVQRVARSAVLLGAVFGWLVFIEARGFSTDFPTLASREQFAQSLGGNSGLTAVIGPARRIDTVGGYVAWRMLFLLIVVGAVWGLLAATRAMRGEEDTGRWELLLAGRTTRRHATVQALTGLAAGFGILWALTAAATAAAGARADVGFSVAESAFYATAGTAGAAIFLAVGALTSQLAGTRRQANGLAAAVFAVSYLIRMVADSVIGLAWLRWASPLGWVENLAPLTGSRWPALVPIVLLVVAAAGAAIALADRRDVGVGVLVRHEAAKSNNRLLGSPAGLAARLERWVALAWVVGLGLLALIFGITARVAASGNVGVANIEEAVGRLGGREGGVAAWMGYEYLYLAAIVAFAAAGQISALRSEEADGHLDNLLARPVGRGSWLGGRLGVSVALVAAVGLATGIGGWIGVAGSGAIRLGAMLEAGLNVAVPALFVLGLGTLLFGLVPRLAVPILYGLVLWSFVVEIIGSSVLTNRWLLDTAVLSHLGPVPASGLNWTAVAWLAGLGLAAALVGLAAFGRRDLAAA